MSCVADRGDGVKVTKKIGEGVYGEVYSAVHDGHSVALKVFTSTCSYLPVFSACSHLPVKFHD